MACAGTHQCMREELHQDQVMRIVYPAVRNAIEELKRVSRIGPQAPLQRICSGVPVPHFTDVSTFGIIKPEDRMLPAFPLSFSPEGGRLGTRRPVSNTMMLHRCF